jgi:hypothetical protein
MYIHIFRRDLIALTSLSQLRITSAVHVSGSS